MEPFPKTNLVIQFSKQAQLDSVLWFVKVLNEYGLLTRRQPVDDKYSEEVWF